MKFTPKPWAIIIAIFGIMGILYFITTANPWFCYAGPTCCEVCAFLTIIIVPSIVAFIGGIYGMFKKDSNSQ